MVKNPNVHAHDGCRIHYRDIGDYLSRDAEAGEAEGRLDRSQGSVNWEAISHRRCSTTIGLQQRSDAFVHVSIH